MPLENNADIVFNPVELASYRNAYWYWEVSALSAVRGSHDLTAAVDGGRVAGITEVPQVGDRIARLGEPNGAAKHNRGKAGDNRKTL